MQKELSKRSKREIIKGDQEAWQQSMEEPHLNRWCQQRPSPHPTCTPTAFLTTPYLHTDSVPHYTLPAHRCFRAWQARFWRHPDTGNTSRAVVVDRLILRDVSDTKTNKMGRSRAVRVRRNGRAPWPAGKQELRWSLRLTRCTIRIRVNWVWGGESWKQEPVTAETLARYIN